MPPPPPLLPHPRTKPGWLHFRAASFILPFHQQPPWKKERDKERAVREQTNKANRRKNKSPFFLGLLDLDSGKSQRKVKWLSGQEFSQARDKKKFCFGSCKCARHFVIGLSFVQLKTKAAAADSSYCFFLFSSDLMT